MGPGFPGLALSCPKDTGALRGVESEPGSRGERGEILPAKLVVLVSGAGTNLQALLEACAAESYGACVVAVGSDRADAPGLGHARDAGAETFVVPLTEHRDRTAWDRALTEAAAAYAPDLVVFAGFMKIVGNGFVERFPQRIVNTHPALLPAFPGAHAVRDTLAYAVKLTGVTVHLVDAGVDTGPVIAQRAVPVRTDDDESRLHERIKTTERGLLVETVGRMAREGYRVEGRKVMVP